MRSQRGVTERGRARHARERLPAAERRAALIDAALEVFTTSSYAGATTAEIARVAGVSEPILYRHFASKRDLWLACLDTAWDEVRVVVEEKFALQASGAELAPAEMRSPWESPRMPNLWLQGLSGAGDDAALRDVVRAHMLEVHGFIADLFRAQQLAGTIPADRDPEAEAWIFVAGGLLFSVADRLGGVISPTQLAAIGRERRRWLSGS
jgi:AcrR family transcriptional regulator